ncbi:hypothetical protein J3F83DRAFT_173430 [Trichoderma novae-zelandiae]
MDCRHINTQSHVGQPPSNASATRPSRTSRKLLVERDAQMQQQRPPPSAITRARHVPACGARNPGQPVQSSPGPLLSSPSQTWLPFCKSGERPGGLPFAGATRCPRASAANASSGPSCLDIQVLHVHTRGPELRLSRLDALLLSPPLVAARQNLLDQSRRWNKSSVLAQSSVSPRPTCIKHDYGRRRHRCCIRSAEPWRKRRAPCQQSRKHGCSFSSEPLRSRRSAPPAELAVGTAASDARLSVERLPVRAAVPRLGASRTERDVRCSAGAISRPCLVLWTGHTHTAFPGSQQCCYENVRTRTMSSMV